MRSVALLLAFLALANAQCGNWTTIYSFDEWDPNTFVSFQQHIPTQVSFVKGWTGMSTQLRLTVFATTPEVAKTWGFQVTADGKVDQNTAFSLTVVPLEEEATDAGSSSDGSSTSWFVGNSVKLLVSMAMLSSGALADSVIRADCTPTATVQIIMDPVYFDIVSTMVNSGVISVAADHSEFTNVTAGLDMTSCLDSRVQSVYFQSCDKILTAHGLALSSSATLLLVNVFLNDPTNEDLYQDLPHQECALNKFKSAIGASAAANLVLYTDVASATYTSIQNIQSSVETSTPDVWSTFAQEYTGEIVCVNYTIRADRNWGPSFGDAGCDPLSWSCGNTVNYTCVSNDENGVCDGLDFTDRFSEGGNVQSKRGTTLSGPACTGRAGVCIASGTCAAKGGTTVHGACPQYGADILCCSGNGFTYQHPGTVLSGPACSGNHPLTGKPGVCISTAACAAKAGTTARGLCPQYGADILCCAGVGYTYQFPSSGSLCGDYAGQQTRTITGNGGTTYTVVAILRAHLVNPASFGLPADQSDNTMEVTTACAYSKMRTAALAAGVNIKIASGFRTLARQQYFYHCYLTKSCNGGNLAAVPGTSNHGRGIALDLNTDCGGQTGNSPPGACTSGSAVYKWMRIHAKTFGFVRTVFKEPWHWEHRPGTGAPYYQ